MSPHKRWISWGVAEEGWGGMNMLGRSCDLNCSLLVRAFRVSVANYKLVNYDFSTRILNLSFHPQIAFVVSHVPRPQHINFKIWHSAASFWASDWWKEIRPSDDCWGCVWRQWLCQAGVNCRVNWTDRQNTCGWCLYWGSSLDFVKIDTRHTWTQNPTHKGHIAKGDSLRDRSSCELMSSCKCRLIRRAVAPQFTLLSPNSWVKLSKTDCFIPYRVKETRNDSRSIHLNSQSCLTTEKCSRCQTVCKMWRSFSSCQFFLLQTTTVVRKHQPSQHMAPSTTSTQILESTYLR